MNNEEKLPAAKKLVDAVDTAGRKSPSKRAPPPLRKAAATAEARTDIDDSPPPPPPPPATEGSNGDAVEGMEMKKTKSKRVPPPLKRSAKSDAGRSGDAAPEDIALDIETGGGSSHKLVRPTSSSSSSSKSMNKTSKGQYDAVPTLDLVDGDIRTSKDRKDKSPLKSDSKSSTAAPPPPSDGKGGSKGGGSGSGGGGGGDKSKEGKGPDRFKGGNPLQFGVWAHYLAYGAASMVLFCGIFAMIWSQPYSFACEVNGKEIASIFIMDQATQTCGATYTRPDGEVLDVCCDKNNSKNTISGSLPIGILYFFYAWFILLWEDTTWGFGLYFPNDTFFYRNKISPIGLIHITIGIVGLSTYSTALGGAFLVTCGLAYSNAARRCESGDGGRGNAKRTAKKEAEKLENGDEEVTCGEKMSNKWNKFCEECKTACADFMHNYSLRTIINEDRLSVVFWLTLYFGGNFVLFVHTLSTWEDIIRDMSEGLLDGSLDISCNDRLCHASRKAVRYGPITGHAPWAKACGNCLNLNCSLLLLPIVKMLLKKLNDAGVSFARSVNSSDIFAKFFAHPLTRYIPLSKNIEFHKIIACMVFIYSWGHIIFHFLNLIAGNEATLEYFRRFGWDGTAYLTGAIATFAGFIIFTGAPNAVKSVKFEIFLGAHHMFIVFFLALFLHGRVFIYWSCFPVFLYIIERILHIWRGNKPFMLVKVEYIPPVMAVHFRPKNKEDFAFKEGQYVYLNCPDISLSEWHPFTISSAYDDLNLGPRIHLESGEEVVEVPRPSDLPPNAKWNKFCLVSKDYRKLSQSEYIEKSETGYHDFVSCHIKVHGLDDEVAKTWTRRLKEYFETISGGGVVVADKYGDVAKSPFPFYFSRRDNRGDIVIGREYGPNGTSRILRVDGPHSAPTEHYCNYSTCLLVGAGIGLTPCASVLTALIKHQWKKNFNPKVLQFYWIIRHSELDSFQWFMHMLADLSYELKRLKERKQIDDEYYMEMNIYLTQYDSKKPAIAKPLMKLKNEASYYTASDLKIAPSFTAADLYAKCMNPNVESKKQSSKMKDSAPNRCQDIWIWSGRPDWDDIFFEAKKRRIHKDIGVCYCGIAAMGADLRDMCQKYSSVDDDILFSLHKENF